MSKNLGIKAALAIMSILWLMDGYVALRPNTSLATPEEVQAALNIIEKNKKPGDIVVHSPLLSPSELVHLGDLDASSALPSSRVRNSRRIIVLDQAHTKMYGFGSPKKTLRISDGSDLVVKVYEPDAAHSGPVFDLYTDIKQVQMSVEKPAGKVVSKCIAKRPSGGRSCPGQPEWLYLDRRKLVINGQSRECIWAHPTNNGVIVLTIPPLQTQTQHKTLNLKVQTGLTDDAIRTTPGGAEVQTEVQQKGQVLTKVIAPNRIGIYEKTVRIATDKEVQLRITSPKDGRRHHCVMASAEATKL